MRDRPDQDQRTQYKEMHEVDGVGVLSQSFHDERSKLKRDAGSHKRGKGKVQKRVVKLVRSDCPFSSEGGRDPDSDQRRIAPTQGFQKG